MFNRTIIENELQTVGSSPVAHYTRIGTLCHFVPTAMSPWLPGWSSAWATPVHFLNDRMELDHGLAVLRDVANRPPLSALTVRDTINQLLTLPGRLEADAFQMSFSGNPDELGQWRGYAANGMGCSVVTDAVAVKSAADVAGQVIYDPKKQRAFAYKILAQLRHVTDTNVIEQVLIASACYMKHDGFGPEVEFRLLKFPGSGDVKFRESGDRLVPYVDFLFGQAPLPIERINIGPGWQLGHLSPSELRRNHVVQGIQRLLTARGLYSTDIEPSRIPYDPR